MRAAASQVFGWGNFILCLILYAGMWYFYGLIGPLLTDLSAYTNERLFTIGPVVAYALIGALILNYRPWHSVGVVFSLVSASSAVLFFATPYTIYTFLVRSDPTPLASLLYNLRGALWILPVVSVPLLLLTFPDGKPQSNKWSWYYHSIWILAGLYVLSGFLSVDYFKTPIEPFFASHFSHDNLLAQMIADYLLISPLIALVAFIQRWRMASGVQKVQIKWLLFGGLVSVFSLSILLFEDFISPAFTSSTLDVILTNLAFLALPVFVGLGILRYRLFDIDLIIRKTLLYSTLTALLGLVFFGVVVVLQELFGRVSGQANSPLAIVISTLAIAALFNPLRGRLQNFIDRRFFRQKYNAEQALEAFAQSARDEVEIERLTEALVKVVQQTMQPQSVQLEFRKEWHKTE